VRAINKAQWILKQPNDLTGKQVADAALKAGIKTSPAYVHVVRWNERNRLERDRVTDARREYVRLVGSIGTDNAYALLDTLRASM
jgi:hypothetical protein